MNSVRKRSELGSQLWGITVQGQVGLIGPTSGEGFPHWLSPKVEKNITWQETGSAHVPICPWEATRIQFQELYPNDQPNTMTLQKPHLQTPLLE